jgi:hypothetical protein
MSSYLEKIFPYLKEDKQTMSLQGYEKLYQLYSGATIKEKEELFATLDNQKTKIVKFISQTNPIDPYYVRDITLDYSCYKADEFVKNSQATELLGYLLNFWFEESGFDWADIYQARSDTVQHFINKGFDVNMTVINNPLLHLCAQYGDVELMRFLTQPKHHANINKLNLNHESVLLFSLSKFENIEMLSYLLTVPNIDPCVGHNILAYSFDKDYLNAAQILMNSQFFDNEAIQDSLKSYHSSLVKALVEKHVLDSSVNNNTQLPKKLKL